MVVLEGGAVSYGSEVPLQAETASVVSMATWCDERGVERVSYVVIDVEGFEPKVLSLSKVISPTKPSTYRLLLLVGIVS